VEEMKQLLLKLDFIRKDINGWVYV
jgi:hypothetical protein